MNKYWYKLLLHFDKNYYFQNGLTLPFIIGSKTIIEPTTKIQSISEIFEDFKESNVLINVLKCGAINEFVFRIATENDQKIYGGIENLVIIDESFVNAQNLKNIIDELENKYTEIINSKAFSKNYGKWEDYSLVDKNRIKEII